MLPDVVLNYLVGTPEKLYNLELKDFYGDDYDRLRPLNYVIVDVVMLCFSIMSPQSLVAVEDTWAPEAKKFVPNAPTVLVGIRGTCFDEEDDETDASMEARLRKMNLEPVTEVAARRVMERIGAVEYVECNLQEMEDMETAFKQV
jgi:GTPase SAR1 family protein